MTMIVAPRTPSRWSIDEGTAVRCETLPTSAHLPETVKVEAATGATGRERVGPGIEGRAQVNRRLRWHRRRDGAGHPQAAERERAEAA